MLKTKSESKIVISLTSSSVELSIVEFSTPVKILFSKKEKMLVRDAFDSKDFKKSFFPAD